MRFTFVAPRFHTNFYYLTKVLIDHGHEVRFLSLYQGGSENHDLVRPQILGYSPLFKWWNKFRNPRGGKLIKNQYELRYGFPPVIGFLKALVIGRSEVVVVKDVVTTYSLMALVFGRLVGARLIVLAQIPKYRSRFKSGAVKWAWILFRAQVITPVEGHSEFANHNQNLHYLPFVHPQMVKEKNFSSEAVKILCVGKFQTRKNQLLLTQAVNDLKRRHKVELLLVGQTDEKDYFSKLMNYIGENQLVSMVTVINDLPWKQMPELYRQSDVFVLPSYADAAAYSVVEAMAYGLPVISSDDNGTSCYIKPGENGYVFRYDDLGDLIKKLEVTIGDRNELLRMSQKSLEFVGQFHNPEKFYSALMKIISTHHG